MSSPSHREPLLPPELPLVCALVPLAATPLVVPNLFGMAPLAIARSFLGMELAFVSFPLLFEVFYRWGGEPLVKRWPRSAWPLHLLAGLAVSPVLSLAVRPLHNFICGFEVGVAEFAVISVAFSCLCLWPAVAYQRLRQRAKAVEQQALLQRQSALKAQLEALQARTNPHFFFNSLNTALSLIPGDPNLAERTLERLADLFRYSLEAAKTQTVPLSRELEVVADFLAIQQARFKDKLSTSIEVDQAAAGVAVPPLLLQPLAENAVLHGLSNRAHGAVSVVARREGERIVIEIADDGPGPGASSHRGTGTSLADLQTRLSLLYGAAARCELLPNARGGCTARLELPA